MFAWWGRTVVTARWWVLAASLALAIVGGAWGTGVFGSLSGGGFDDPHSPSSLARAGIDRELGRQSQDVLVLYSSPAATVDEPAMRDPVLAVLARLRQRPEVTTVVSYYDTHLPAFVSTDRHATYIAIQLSGGGENARRADLDAIRPVLAAGGGLTTEVGGLVPFSNDANTQIKADIVKAELVSLPILFILMIIIFRGVVAAATPLLVGVLAILGALMVTRLLTTVTDVSVFAANIITMLGLGMAIDYALFVVSRFREELGAGHAEPDRRARERAEPDGRERAEPDGREREVAAAVARTVSTAGRTVMVSGLTVTLALAGLLVFPVDFLKSMAYGGMAAVSVAMLAGLTALPALLAVVGPRINALRVPVPWRRRAAQSMAADEGGWARLARSVMLRPILYALAVTTVLLVMATPFLQAKFGGFDERILPKGTQSRTVAERIASDFPGGNTAPVLALVSGASPQAALAYAQGLGALPGVTAAIVTATNGSESLVVVTYAGEATSEHARDVVEAVRAQPPPAGARVLVGGRPAAEVDLLATLADRLPRMALLVAAATFLLLFLAFGSLVLPAKAIGMNLISIGASFGVVVWIFQDGHLAGWLGFTSTGFLEPTNLILMLVVLFGLSTDYEVFLLSRVREEWDATADNRAAVAAGLQRTGGIITAAALLLIVVVGGFASGGAATIKMLGIGTVVAVAVDAALVRTLLVPATMRLLGRWNWWAPGPLARVYRRHGLRKADEPGAEPVPSPRTPVDDVSPLASHEPVRTPRGAGAPE
jgi:trehalose monomycolate/heme transporter